jgi:hypothetical protein
MATISIEQQDPQAINMDQFYKDTAPLSVLQSGGTVPVNLQYPRDLKSSQKAHSVRFDIVQPVIDPTLKEQGSQFLQATGEAISNVTSGETSFSTLYESAITGAKTVKNKVMEFSTLRDEPKGSVELYMPDTLNFNYPVEYNNSSLASIIRDTTNLFAGKGLLGSTAKAVGGLFEPGNSAKFALSKIGFAFNPQQITMFEGVQLRTFSFSFTFTPYSAQEAQQIKNIIKAFRMFAAPTSVNAAAGFFFEPPAVFDIKFLYKGQENKNINKVYRSVLESVDVNYAPNGWAAHEDGSPVQSTLSLNFKETLIVDRAKIQSE